LRPADKQLLAGRNDVLAYWKVCRRLGYRPEHIRALTSPTLTPADILRAEQELAPELHPKKSAREVEALVEGWFAGTAPKVVLGEATREAILAGVQWLAAQLVFTVKLEWEGWKLDQELAALPGFLAYSGHGARVEGDLALCPRDVGSALERAVPFTELRKLVDAGDDIRVEGTPYPADNLTVVLDCCFASAGSAGKAFRVPTLTPGEIGKAPALKKEIGSRVFCAAGRDEQGYQAMLGGHWHGAFTWAFTRALEQWKTAPSGQFRKSTVSHMELLFRARMLLEALSFPQHPVLVDQIGNLPVFQHDSDASAEASAEPNAERRGVQLDPSVDVLKLGDSTLGYLSPMYQSVQYNWVNYSKDIAKAQQHMLVRSDSQKYYPRDKYNGTDQWLCVGDQVNIMTKQPEEYRYISSQLIKDSSIDYKSCLTYQDRQDDYATWVICRGDAAKGSLIHPGDTIQFQSVKDPTKYLNRYPTSIESNYFLDLGSATDLQSNWQISRA
jgi:hypothetical protein